MNDTPTVTKTSLRPFLATFALLTLLASGLPAACPAAEGVEVWGKVQRVDGPPEEHQPKAPSPAARPASAQPPAAQPAGVQPVLPSSLQGPEKLPEIRVTDVSAVAQDNGVSVKVSLDKVPGKVLYFSLANPVRLVVDIHPGDDDEVKIKGQLPKSFTGLAEFVPALRVNAFESSVRLVFDLKCKAMAKNAKPVIAKDGKSVSIRVDPSVCAN